jgi:hypothetical protein
LNHEINADNKRFVYLHGYSVVSNRPPARPTGLLGQQESLASTCSISFVLSGLPPKH